jgi:phosphoenolpyruvate carboxylase
MGSARAWQATGAACALLLAQAGCANLDAVRRFAKASSAAARCDPVVDDYARSPVRQLRYEPEPFRRQLEEVAARRAEQRKRLEAAQAVLVGYLGALGDLAADDVPNVDADMDGLLEALETGKYIGDGDGQIGAESASAAAAIAKVLLRAAADRWRQQRLVELIRETDPRLQTLVAGLREIVDQDLRTSLAQEEEALRKPFLAWKAAAVAGGDPDGAPRAASALLEERLAVLQDRRTALDQYLKALGTIAQGHAELRQNVDHLRKRELVDRLAVHARDLATLARSIRKLTT